MKDNALNTMPQAKTNEFAFYAFLENSLSPAWIADEFGYVLFVNKVARNIWHIDEAYVHRHVHELFPKTVTNEFFDNDKQVFDTGQPVALMVHTACDDGSAAFYMLHKFLLPDHNGKRLIASQATDITKEMNMEEAEHRKLEAKLLRQKIQKQKAISKAIIAAQDKVANELGKELHDNVNQLLASAGIILEFASEQQCENVSVCIDKSRQYIKMAIEEIRKISKTLNTTIIREAGLIKPVQEIIGTMKLNRGIDVQFECDLQLEAQLSPDQKLMFYRIIQEQTNNIIKYAAASEVLIALSRKTNGLQLVIRDNGKGFDLKQVKRGIGLANIRNRAETFNGSLNIITAPGAGCHLEVAIPVTTRRSI